MSKLRDTKGFYLVNAYHNCWTCEKWKKYGKVLCPEYDEGVCPDGVIGCTQWDGIHPEWHGEIEEFRKQRALERKSLKDVFGKEVK